MIKSITKNWVGLIFEFHKSDADLTTTETYLDCFEDKLVDEANE